MRAKLALTAPFADSPHLEGLDLPPKPLKNPDPPDIPAELQPAPAGPTLDKLSLEGARLERADFSGQVSSETRLDQCRLIQTDLSGATIARMLVRDAVVTGGSWANLRVQEMQLRRVTLAGVRMTGATLATAVFEDVSLTDCRIDLASLRSAKLTRVRFERCRLDEIDFGGAKLGSVEFIDCILVKSLWTDATLTTCEMRGTDISGAGNPERLRGVRMPWPDVLASAGVLAAAVGIEVVD